MNHRGCVPVREDGTVPVGSMSSDAFELMLRNVLKETTVTVQGGGSVNVPSIEGSGVQSDNRLPSEFGPRSVSGSLLHVGTSQTSVAGGSVNTSMQTEGTGRSRQRGVRKPGKYSKDHAQRGQGTS